MCLQYDMHLCARELDITRPLVITLCITFLMGVDTVGTKAKGKREAVLYGGAELDGEQVEISFRCIVDAKRRVCGWNYNGY